jgi:peroxiredoxin Q/BCP
VAVVACLAVGMLYAQEVKVGDKAPAFEAPDETGKVWKSTDHVGKKVVVLYFYPADFTGGCTKQACGYRDNFQKLADKGVEVVGVSGDTPKTHELFKKEHKLPFTLLADEDGAIAKKFGVPVGKGGKAKAKIDGKDLEFTRGATIQRFTVVIDKDGKIIHHAKVANAAEDSKQILDLLSK